MELFSKPRSILYKMVPKFHDLWHFLEQARFQNPRTFTCYKGEDFVGLMSDVGHSCQHGTSSGKVSKKVGEKMRLLMHSFLTLGLGGESADK